MSLRTRGRILVVGDSGVGKSSLVQKICYGRVCAQSEWTIGCQVEVKLCEDNGPEAYFVEFLDVGCHNNHKLSRSIYYHGVDGILLVYDISNSKSFVNLRKWVSELSKSLEPRRRAPTPHGSKLLASLPVLVVGNKSDLTSRTQHNVAKTIGFDSVNISSVVSSPGDLDEIEAFIRTVVDSKSGQEVSYGVSDHLASGMALP